MKVFVSSRVAFLPVHTLIMEGSYKSVMRHQTLTRFFYIYIMFSWLDPRRDVFGFNDLRWEVVVPFVDTSEIVYHHSKLQKGCTRLEAASDKAYQLLAHGRWFSPASSTTKSGRHDIAEILLKVALKHQTSNQITVLIFSLTWLKYNRKNT